ncbi:T6SS effector phospholipase Tle3 domain-containing protein [Dyella monticola]|nr:DUF3274 domain-containing protein [Dyella monticola]
MQRDHLGQPFWESYQTPEGYEVCAECRVPPHLPGIIIFVHGVNSEGEWYEAAEQALCNGLNDRLGRKDLKPNSYTNNDKAQKKLIPRQLTKDNDGRSPVIRFYWGYRPKDGEERRWKVPLRNIQGDDQWETTRGQGKGPWYWGGGPFQNGTNNLQQLWSDKGFDCRVFGAVNLQWFNTEWDRELHDAPGRQYYAHAAQRLANLIDRIRQRHPQDTITVMAHSQGTMVAMAATLMCKTRAPDALVVMNSPFALQDKRTDALVCGSERPTTSARINTFRNVANRIQRDKKIPTEEDREQLHVGATLQKELWHPDAVVNGIKERDNHGRLYVYFNPHDRVMGSIALQSIGWQGVSNDLIAELGDTVKQRMLARGTACGDAPGMKKFGTLPPIANPEPDAEATDFWNGTHGNPMLWAVPHPDQVVTINAEQVPYPVTAEDMPGSHRRRVTRVKDDDTMAYQAVDRYFDEARRDQDDLGARDNEGKYLDASIPYLESIHDREKMVASDLVPSSTGMPVERLETRAEMLKRIEHYQPMPTNHSTLPQFEPFMRKVAAWDLPIGFCDAYDSPDFWARLIRDADWLNFTDPYFVEGTLAIPPVPDGIDPQTVGDEMRKAVQAGYLQGVHLLKRKVAWGLVTLIALTACQQEQGQDAIQPSQPQATELHWVTHDVPPQVFYRIDDRRFMTVENYDGCDGQVWYNDTKQGIRTEISEGGFWVSGFVGKLIIDDPTGMNVVVPKASPRLCGDRGCRNYLAYSTDGGRSFHWLQYDIHEHTADSVESSKRYTMSVTSDSLFVTMTWGDEGKTLTDQIPLVPGFIYGTDAHLPKGVRINWKATVPPGLRTPSGQDHYVCDMSVHDAKVRDFKARD